MFHSHMAIGESRQTFPNLKPQHSEMLESPILGLNPDNPELCLQAPKIPERVREQKQDTEP